MLLDHVPADAEPGGDLAVGEAVEGAEQEDLPAAGRQLVDGGRDQAELLAGDHLLLGGPNAVIFPEVIATLFHSSNDKWPEGAAFAMLMLAVSLTTVGLFMRVVGGRSVRLM